MELIVLENVGRYSFNFICIISGKCPLYVSYIQGAPLLLLRDKWSNVQKFTVYGKYEVRRQIKDELRKFFLGV